MIPRHLPPVVTPFPGDSVGSAIAVLTGGGANAPQQLASALAKYYGRDVLALTDSGTSALQLAIALAGGREHPVAIPGFGCIDVGTAVLGADAKARGYDIDPKTLAPDLASIENALKDGARVVVASHLFGIPIPLTDLQALCASYQAILVEDAAQACGARMNGAAVGQHGDFVVLSFGRGKGIGGAGGGALLGTLVGESNTLSSRLRGLPARGNWSTFARLLAAQLLAWPLIYALPASVPSLRLGEMVFHSPSPVRPINGLEATIAASAIRSLELERVGRTHRVNRLSAATSASARGVPIAPTAGAEPGWLRFPILIAQDVAPAPRLGIYRAYPRALGEQHEIATVLDRGLPPLPGAELLAERMVTLPTHRRLSEGDLRALEAWLRGDS